MDKRGHLITIEGIEGVGKSTCIKYLENFLCSKGIPVIITREPGGTAIAEQIRHILLHKHEEKMAVDTELLLMFAARAQHLASVINPALNAGNWILCDRFTDASYAYQGGGRGVAQTRIALLESFVQADFRPNLIILLVAPVELALSRAKNRSEPDRFEIEKEQFFLRAQEVYLTRAKNAPERYRVIDASLTIAEVEAQLRTVMEEYLNANR